MMIVSDWWATTASQTNVTVDRQTISLCLSLQFTDIPLFPLLLLFPYLFHEQTHILFLMSNHDSTLFSIRFDDRCPEIELRSSHLQCRQTIIQIGKIFFFLFGATKKKNDLVFFVLFISIDYKIVMHTSSSSFFSFVQQLVFSSFLDQLAIDIRVESRSHQKKKKIIKKMI